MWPKNKIRQQLRKPSRKLSAGKKSFSLDKDGSREGGLGTHIVGIVIFIVGQLDHAIGALDKGR